MKKNIYKWHRRCSLIIAVPVLLWAGSGFMHPIMTNIRPNVTTQGLTPWAVDSSKIRVPLQTALLNNHIDSFVRCRIVHIDTNWFYQVQINAGKEPVYLGTLNGRTLTAGDWLYAQWLAREFLEGQHNRTQAWAPVSTHAQAPGPSHTSPSGPALSLTGIAPAAAQAPSFHDCCDDATASVLNTPKGSKVSDAAFIRAYTSEYKSINRLLPVYKVSFERADGIRVYVETTQDRFAFAMDDKRRVFDRIFTLIHTWEWLEFLGKGKLAVEFLLAFTAFSTACMGIYIFFTTRSKKVKLAGPGGELVKARRNHRYISICIALFTLMFTFSGAFHALYKFKEDPRDRYGYNPRFASSGIDLDFRRLQEIVKDPILNIGLVKIHGHAYWQINTADAVQKVLAASGSVNAVASASTRKDLMKDTRSDAPRTIYVSVEDHRILPEGELKYAVTLAASFSGYPEEDTLSTTVITRFTNEYNFTDKRLPVWKINYSGNGNERFYVETATGKLSKRINDRDLVESYSFAFLHKHEFMAWGGKGLKDLSTMFWAFAQLVMVSVGLILYFKWSRRQRQEGKIVYKER